MASRKDSEKQFGEAMTTGSPRLKPARVIVLATGFLRAQAPGAGTIAGTVTDPSGAVVATPEGGFRLSLLPPGNDSMAVAEQGFRQPTLRSIHVAVRATAIVNGHCQCQTGNRQGCSQDRSPRICPIGRDPELRPRVGDRSKLERSRLDR